MTWDSSRHDCYRKKNTVNPKHAFRRSRHIDVLASMSDVAFVDAREKQARGHWRDVIGKDMLRCNEIVLEIGCFDAEFLIDIAHANPGVGFVGLDWKAAALCKAAARIIELGLKNIRLIHGRAQVVDEMFAPMELSEVWLLHPDPCDGENELKNRLFSGEFLIRLANTMSTDGLFLLKTDHPGYFQWAASAIGAACPDLRDGRRVKKSELMQDIDLPGKSDRAMELWNLLLLTANWWEDEVVASWIKGRLIEGRKTLFERRFVNKRWPIYGMELQRSRIDDACD